MILEPTSGGSRPKNVRSGIGQKSDRPSEGRNEPNRDSGTTPVFLAHSKHKLWGTIENKLNNIFLCFVFIKGNFYR